MKLLLINTSDVGGAGRACARLHLGLLDSGVDSKFLLASKRNNYEESYTIEPLKEESLNRKIKNKFIKILRELKIVKPPKKSNEEFFFESRKSGLELFSYPHSNYDITESKLYKEADIINLHWVSGFMDYKSFFNKNNKPVVWTLHDMNPFSGGEHYRESYYGIDDKGFPKNRVITNKEKEQFNKILGYKKEALSDVKDLHFVTLCKWMTKELNKSEFFSNFPIHCIPNGIDSGIYKIRDKAYSRNLLNIPLDKKVILFVADLINTSRKGFEFLLIAIKKLNKEDVLLFVIGNKNDKLNEFDNIIQYGMVNDERLLSSIYSSADVFIIPSLMDNLPNTVIESLLCGTPVIGFPIGGIPDMVQDKENGLLTNEISVDALVTSIHYFLENGVSLSRQEIRNNAVIKYDKKVQADNYIKLFKKIMNDK